MYGAPYGQGPLLPGAAGPLSIGNRVVAWIIDFVIVAVPLGIIDLVVVANILRHTHTVCDTTGYCYVRTTTGGGGLAIVDVIGIAIGLVFIYMTGKYGQTPGKRIMGVKVVDANTGQVIGFWRAFGRAIVQGLSNLLCFAGLWSAFLDSSSGRYQGWHDKALTTQVISVK